MLNKKRHDYIVILGFVFSLISLIIFPLSILGLGFSIWGLLRIDKNKLKGNGMAIAGIIISSIMFLVTIVFALMFMVLFYYISENPNYLNELNNTQQTNSTNMGITNPASNYCVNGGNQLEIRNDSNGGQYGICISKGKKECEEWAYFRGECSL